MDNQTITSLINKNLILVDLDVDSKDAAINMISRSIEKEGRLNDYDGFIKAVYDREEIFPTAIGYNFAIPHGKSDAVDTATVALGILKEEIQWSEEETAKYIFVIAVPEKEAGDTHLQVLAKLSRMIMRDEFRDSLKNAASVEEVYDILQI